MYELKYLFCFFLISTAVLFSAEVQDYIFSSVSTAPIAEQQENARFVENFKDGHILTDARIKDDNGYVYTAYYLFFDPDNAEDFYQVAQEEVERQTDKFYFYETLALQAVEQENYMAAEKLYTEALQKADDPGLLGNKLGLFDSREFLWNNLGVFYMTNRKDPIKAAEYFNKAYQRSNVPYYRSAFYENLLYVFAARQKQQEILDLFADYAEYIERGESLSAENKASYLHQAYSALDTVYYNLNASEFKQLAATLKPLAKKYSQSRAIVNNYAAALMDGEEYDKAIPIFEQMSRDFPDYFYPPYNLGWIYYNKGAYAKAEKWYWKAREIKPEDSRLNEEIFDLYSKWITQLEVLARQENKPKDWQEILSLAQKQVILFPDLVGTNYYLACVHSILNKKTEALFYLEQAYRINPEQTKTWVRDDEDLRNVKNETEFQKLFK